MAAANSMTAVITYCTGMESAHGPWGRRHAVDNFWPVVVLLTEGAKQVIELNVPEVTAVKLSFDLHGGQPSRTNERLVEDS